MLKFRENSKCENFAKMRKFAKKYMRKFKKKNQDFYCYNKK